MMRVAGLLVFSLVTAAAVPAAAEWWKPDVSLPALEQPAPVVALTDLYVQLAPGQAPLKVTDLIRQPVHVGADRGPALQLPGTRIPTHELVRSARLLSLYDADLDTWLDRSELTQALLAWAVTSVHGTEFGKVTFLTDSGAAALVPVGRFVLNYDDSAYVRRTIVQHGRPGSADMLGQVGDLG